MESRAPAALRVNALTFERLCRFSLNLVHVTPNSRKSSKIGRKQSKMAIMVAILRQKVYAKVPRNLNDLRRRPNQEIISQQDLFVMHQTWWCPGGRPRWAVNAVNNDILNGCFKFLRFFLWWYVYVVARHIVFRLHYVDILINCDKL